MKLFLILLLFSSLCFAQYTVDDSLLVRTTFERSFDKNIIYGYLTSNDTTKVNAALLSISQSDDQTFIDSVLKVNFDKHYQYICFALGQLGQSAKSENFLLSKLSFRDSAFSNFYVLDALGKTGSSAAAKLLIDKYFSSDKKYFSGISLALNNFFQRKLIDNYSLLKILASELSDSANTIKRKYEAAFTLYRAGSSPELRDLLYKDLLRYLFAYYNSYEEYYLQYIFENFRALKYFPFDRDLLKQIHRIKSTLLRIEAAKSAVYFNFTKESEIDDYLSFLMDRNSNVSRVSAIALRNINFTNQIKNYLKQELLKLLRSRTINWNTRGELLLSFLQLYPQNNINLLAELGSLLPKRYLYRAYSKIPNSNEAKLFLISKLNSEQNKYKIEILPTFLNYLTADSVDMEIDRLVLNSISSDFPPLVSIASEGVDTTFINRNKPRLKEIIINSANNNMNNPDFIESIVSLAGLAERIDDSLYTKLLNILSGSKVYSIRKFAYTKRNLKIDFEKNDENFYTFFDNAFEYKFANINTAKGSFKIKFLPEFAPITVGSFCYLSLLKKFNDIAFHRVVPGFVIQGGDPTETGWGGPGYEIISEFSPLNYSSGMVGMASAGKDTEGSQWFVTTGSYPHLNGRYTIFAQVVEGFDIVEEIEVDDKCISIDLIY